MGLKGYWKVTTIRITGPNGLIGDGTVLTIQPDLTSKNYHVKWGSYDHDTSSTTEPSGEYAFSKTANPAYSGKIKVVGSAPGVEIMVGVIGDTMPGFAMHGGVSTNADVFVAVRTDPP